MALDEILFCQLLEALMDGGRELAAHIQAEHILNGTFQLQVLYSKLGSFWLFSSDMHFIFLSC